jgi:hypothetical protein
MTPMIRLKWRPFHGDRNAELNHVKGVSALEAPPGGMRNGALTGLWLPNVLAWVLLPRPHVKVGNANSQLAQMGEKAVTV